MARDLHPLNTPVVRPPKPKWFDTGNVAHGFVAIGNLASGFIAIGNVARGVIAIGNLAIGVVAVGNVGFGVIGGGGASLGIGFLAFAAAVPLGVLDSVGLAGEPPLPLAVLGIVPVIAWAVLSFAMRGKRTERELPQLTPLAALRDRSASTGWVLGRVSAGRSKSSPQTVSLVVGRERVSLSLTPYTERLFASLHGAEVLAQIEPEERVKSDDVGYREGAARELVLVCRDLIAAPPEPPIWQTPADIQWVLARVWRGAAVVGLIAWVVRLIVA